jgi:hypothetical protein
MSEAPSGIGHNLPPDDPFARAAELVENANRWIKERPEIADEEQAGAAQLAIDQLRKVKEDLEADLKARRQPHDQAIADLRVLFRDPLELIGIAMTRLQEIGAAWLQKKRDRLAAEKAEQERIAQVARDRANAAIIEAVTQPSVEADLLARRATEDAAKLSKAAAKPVPRAQVRGDFSEKAMSLRATWKAEPIKGRETEAIRAYAKDAEVRAAALKAATSVASRAAKAAKRADAAPAGWRFFKTETAV